MSYASFQCPTSDNPHLAHAFLQAQREELGEAMYAQEFGASVRGRLRGGLPGRGH